MENIIITCCKNIFNGIFEGTYSCFNDCVIVTVIISDPFFYSFAFVLQTKKRVNVVIFQKEGSLSTGWLLLEKEERWKDYTRRSYEAESSRNRGKSKKNTLLKILIHLILINELIFFNKDSLV